MQYILMPEIGHTHNPSIITLLLLAFAFVFCFLLLLLLLLLLFFSFLFLFASILTRTNYSMNSLYSLYCIHSIHTAMLSPGTPSSPTPREDFNETLRNEKKMGNTVASDKRKSSGRVVQFNDGSTLRLLNTGHMVHDRSDGSKQQRNPDGKGITVPPQHTHTHTHTNVIRLSNASAPTPFPPFLPHTRSKPTAPRSSTTRMAMWSFSKWMALPSRT